MSATEERERDGLRFMLGSAMTAYPGEGFASRLEALAEAAEADDLTMLVRALADEAAVDELRGDYVDLFDRREGHVPLYATEYGRGRATAKGHELADLSGFYRAFGVSLGGLDGEDHLSELPDHVAVELEFHGYLLLKEAALDRAGDREGLEIVRDAQRKFLGEHLAVLLPTIVQALGGRHSTYARIFEWCAALVAAECARVDVVPGAPRPRADEAEEDVSQCGALPVIQ